MKKKLYTIQGSFSDSDLPINDLVDIDELLYYRQIQPIAYDHHIPTFLASDIEAIAMKIYQEYLEAKKIRKQKQSFNLNRFPFLKQKLDFFLIKNPKLAKNRLFLNFLENEKHRHVFVLSLFNDLDCEKVLNQYFREFYFEYRFLAYMNKILYFKAISFDKKQSMQRKREALILEQPISYEEETTLLDTIATTNEGNDDEITDNSFKSYLTDEKLYEAFQQLTDYQQEILTLAYVKKLKDVEIASVFNISQQAVSKAKKAALEKIRKALGVSK